MSGATYEQLMSVSPPEAGRQSSNIVPQQGSQLSSKSLQTVQFMVPSIAYADWSSSYLSFNVRLSATPTSTTTANTYVAIDGMSTSLIDNATLFNSADSTITEVRNVDVLAQHLLSKKGFEYATTIGKNMMGLSSSFSEVESTFTGLGLLVTPALTYADATVGARALPGVCAIPAGSLAGVKVQGEKVNLAIPLEYLSPMFKSTKSRYFPCHLAGNRTSCLKLDVNFNNVKRALVAFSSATTEANQAAAIARIDNENLEYVIDSMEIVIEYVQLGDKSDQEARRISESPKGLEYHFNDYTTRTVGGGDRTATFFSFQNSKSTMSLKNISVLAYPTLQRLAYPNITGSKRFGATSAHFKVGPSYYPNSKIQFNSNTFNAKAYAELSKTARSLQSLHGHYNAGSFHQKNAHGFAVGVDMDSKSHSGAVSDESLEISGKNTSTGNAQTEILIDRVLDSENDTDYSYYVIFGTDNIVVVSNGVASPLERA